MPAIEAPENIREFPLTFVSQSVTLATSGFGVVVALAWNEFIQKVIQVYIEPYLGKSSGIASQGIYALVMTFLAVVVTMQLVSVQKTLERVVYKKNKTPQAEVKSVPKKKKKSKR